MFFLIASRKVVRKHLIVYTHDITSLCVPAVGSGNDHLTFRGWGLWFICRYFL